jgi:hypothetical protein
MKQVVGVSLGSSKQDFEFTTRFMGQRMTVRRVGTQGSLARAGKALRQWETRADVLALGLPAEHLALGSAGAAAGGLGRLRAQVQHAPLTTGDRLGEIFEEWSLRHAQHALGHYFDNALVVFHSGLAHHKLAATMAEYTENLQFADPLLQLGVPKLLTSLDALGLYASGAHMWPTGHRRGCCRRRCCRRGRATCCARPCQPGHGAGGAGARARRPSAWKNWPARR